MTRILFVCHGNICRSPMAEFVMKDMVRRAGRENDFLIESAATSREELGNDMHYGTRQKLREMGIPFSRRAARQIRADDYDKYDFLVAMDDENVYYMNRCWAPDSERKIVRLLAFAGKTRDIADPWYTGNFDQTYDDIVEGCTAFLKYCLKE
ncbi:MAG: low molecular weight phosphotyrosine protein phosphatase [Spirochaetales bacterium]|nr:low molecular weight phosphotyrosine protein phosphatase [Spirochaetales bacterium]